jgi:ADP-dependent NAD(P)H-hydrate dehydratase
MTRTPRVVTIDAALLQRWPLPDPDATDDKEARGQVLVIGGSRTVPGAALLTAAAALRAGAGKLQVATARDVAIPLALELPEARVFGLRSDRDGEIDAMGGELRRALEAADAIAIGPGVANTRATARLTRAVLKTAHGTVVLDAGAIAAAHDCTQTRKPAIITPHHGEMAALLDIERRTIDARAEALARQTARETNAVVVLKAPTTWIASPDGRCWRHDGGVAGLGTSGSGDVLAGLITGLTARGASAEQAAVFGVRLHALAGARLARRIGAVGFLARELAPEIPALMHDISRRRRTRTQR